MVSATSSSPPRASFIALASGSLARAVYLALASALIIIVTNELSLMVVNSTSSVEMAERGRTLVWAVGTVLFIGFSSIALGMLARAIASGFRLSAAEQRRIFWGFTFAGPWLVGFVIFVLGPALVSFLYSFTDYKLGDPAGWVGLENYRVLLTGEGAHGRRFAQAMYNSFYYALVGVPLQIFTALGMALLLNMALRGMRVFRLIFYVPVILAGGPAILLAWRYMLASNGGFINETLQGLANNFFLFDWIYRFFIYSVEGFNGFYAGITRGDSVGPLVYAVPALLGALMLLTLLRGEWGEHKRLRAWRVAEVIGIIVVVILMGRALIQQPLDMSMILMSGVIIFSAIIFNRWQQKPGHVRGWQIGGLVVTGIALFVALFGDTLLGMLAAEPDTAYGDRLTHVIALLLVGIPLALSLLRLQPRLKTGILGGGMVLLLGLLLISVLPGEFGGGSLRVLPQYVALGSAIEQPANLDYLNDTFPIQGFSPLWVWGGVALLLGGIAALNNRYPRTQRRVLWAVLVLLALFTVGAFADTVRYFQAFEQIAAANGTPNYHFSLLHQSMAEFPDANRVPLWLSNELWSKPSLILITMWSSGAGMLIFLAALKGVPEVFYEAAKVDGANRLQRFLRITLPMISPAMFYNIVVGVIAALQTFEAIYIISNTTTQDSLSSAAFFLYVRTFRQLAIGQGSAVSWILAVIIVLLTVFQFRYSRWVHYEV